jgi:L-fucose isomerase-like protein
MMTENGNLRFYAGEGDFTSDPVPTDFFGCAGVASIPNLQDVLLYVAKNGHRHHVSVTPGKIGEALREALESYLGFDIAYPQGL